MMKGGATLAILAVAAAAAVAACSTEEQVRFADGGCVAGGCQAMSGGSAAAGGSCTPDAGCAVSFKNDVYAGILDGPAGCTASGCHAAGTANGNLELNKGAAEAAYAEILNYALNKPAGAGGPYVALCYPASSRLLCNLATETMNPYPLCGTAMPVGKKITQAQFDQIAEWIACGAPDN